MTTPPTVLKVMRRYHARLGGYKHCDDIPPPPKDGRCKICRRKRKLVPDHNHKTGKFRGWICVNCNVGLGHFQESKKIMFRALAFLTGAL